jgi:hypothetical protein
MLKSTARRALAACSLILASSVVVGATVQTASAEPVVPVKAKVKARTYIKKLDREVKRLRGTFKGTLDAGTGKLRGKLRLPPATVGFPSNELGIVEAEFSVGRSKVRGNVDFENAHVTAMSKFKIRITSVTAAGLPVNAAGDRCKSSDPIKVPMEGPFSATEPATYTGVYTIPPFQNCQLLTPVLNLLIPGPDNTFTARFKPVT